MLADKTHPQFDYRPLYKAYFHPCSTAEAKPAVSTGVSASD